MSKVAQPPHNSTGAVVNQELLVERLVSGDYPSVLALGIHGAAALRKMGMAVFMVDALGRVHVMPVESVQVLTKPRLPDDVLDSYTEDDAIELLVKQEDSEEEILAYLKRRKERSHGNSSL